MKVKAMAEAAWADERDTATAGRTGIIDIKGPRASSPSKALTQGTAEEVSETRGGKVAGERGGGCGEQR